MGVSSVVRGLIERVNQEGILDSLQIISTFSGSSVGARVD